MIDTNKVKPTTEAQDFAGVADSTEVVDNKDGSNDAPHKHITFKSVPSFQDIDSDGSPLDEEMEDYHMRPRAMSHHLSSTKVPSRTTLKYKARVWRSLMQLGMTFHGWTAPSPPKPMFKRSIRTNTIPIDLYFYVSAEYQAAAKSDPTRRFPVVVNFHGGGFTMGDATDDRYYARIILEHTTAVFVAVNYRRAPEHPFPGPVDDGVEALMYLSSHSTELRIDPGKTALSGFSAGGNLCFTVPFRLTYFTNPKRPRLFPGPDSYSATPDISRVTTKETIHAVQPDDGKEDINPRTAASTTVTLRKPVSKVEDEKHNDTNTGATDDEQAGSLPASQISSRAPSHHAGEHSYNERDGHLAPPSDVPNEQGSEKDNHSGIPKKVKRPGMMSRTTTWGSHLNPDRPTNLKILSIVAFYPLVDWTSSRNAKIRGSIKPELTLKKTFTDLFDYSYLPPPDIAGDHVSPYASPALAPDEMIADGLPERMQIFLCEYDMLLSEGTKFCEKLEEKGKQVHWQVVPGAKHAWDKSPNPFRNQQAIDELYVQSAKRLQAIFDEAEKNPAAVRGERIGLGGLR